MSREKKLVNKIVEFFSAKFQFNPKIYCFADIEIETEEKRSEIINYLKKLKDDDLILIVDDVSITGNRFTYLSKDIAR